MNKYHANTQFVGKKSKYLQTCSSTNLVAFEESSENTLEEGFAWIAGHQTSGRGQRGNTWEAKPGENLLVSYLLKPKAHLLENQFYLSKAVALGIIYGLQEWAKSSLGETIPLQIKWPNDIYLDNHKIGGVLIENNFQAGKWTFSIVGIGLNINQMEFPDLRANSLKKWIQNPFLINIEEIYQSISIGIEKYYSLFLAQSFEIIDLEYHRNLLRYQEWSTFEEKNIPFLGKIVQVNHQGLLLMQKESGIQTYDLKEIIFIFQE
ncbi:biotin--[acetyl-CoA-carboxylase] ligase [Aquirufa sp. ROCK2-A2]